MENNLSKKYKSSAIYRNAELFIISILHIILIYMVKLLFIRIRKF